MTMNRTAPIVAISILIAALTAASFGYYNKSTRLESENVKKQKTIAVLTEQGEIKDEQIDILETEVAGLKDSIATLHDRIDVLKKDLRVYKERNRSLEGKIKRRERKIKDLEKKITKYARSDKDYSWKIKQLEKEKLALIGKIEGMSGEIIENQRISADKKKVSDAEKIRLQKMEKARDIVDNTKIIYKKVQVREQKSTGNLRKIKKNKKWRYTTLYFHIQHENGNKPIMDENFVILIRDLDTDRILPFNEGNPKFPGKMHESGVKVKFNGNMVMLDYLNTEVKAGKNYAAEVYYILDGNKFKIPTGTMQFVKDGKVIAVD